MTSHADRGALYARLEEVLGPEPAATLMTMFPDGDRLATKADLADLVTKADLADFVTKADLADFVTKADLKNEIRELRTELRADIRDLNGALRSQFRTFVVTQTATVFGVASLVVAIQQWL